MQNIAKALLEAQKEMSNPVKGSNNPFFKSKYADLNAVRESIIPVLNTHGISVLQPMVHIEGKNFIKTVFLHESGEMLEGLTEIIYSKQNDAQAQGSGITYARRYGLASLACVGADDDDGNAASKPNDTKQQTPKRETPTLSEALGEVAIATTSDKVAEIWAKYPQFKKEESFIKAVKEKGESFKNK